MGILLTGFRSTWVHVGYRWLPLLHEVLFTRGCLSYSSIIFLMVSMKSFFHQLRKQYTLQNTLWNTHNHFLVFYSSNQSKDYWSFCLESPFLQSFGRTQCGRHYEWMLKYCIFSIMHSPYKSSYNKFCWKHQAKSLPERGIKLSRAFLKISFLFPLGW